MKTTITLKTVLFIAAIFCLNQLSFAQDNNENSEIGTLFNKDQNISHGGYAALEFGYTPVAGRSAMLTGFQTAWVIDHTLELGINAKAFVTNPLPDVNLENRNYMYTGGYGGLHIAATIMGDKPINVSFPVLLGAGAISYIRTEYTGYYDDFYPESHYAYFVIEPGIDVQLNMTRFFRISAGVSYRYTSDIYLIYSNTSTASIASPSILRGVNASIKFKFGKF
jgi:hypothetical protein